MKKAWILLILVLVLTACTSTQTEALPPTETSIPETPTPNPFAEDAFIAFCNSANEYDVEKAQKNFTEDIKIIMTETAVHEGLSGVEEFIDVFKGLNAGDCKVKSFQVKGDKVRLTWTHSWVEENSTIKAICPCNATMEGDKIKQAIFNCEFIVIE